MKALSLTALAITVTSALCCGLAAAHAGAEATEFPNAIQPELGATEFAPGDQITITSFRGDRPHLEVGGSFLLEGTYTLASAEEADLAWFSTSRGPSGGGPISHEQHVKVSKGSGTFHLKKTLAQDGWLHISFYVNGQPHGGIYFGEKGFENTVLRQKGWSDFSRGPAAKAPEPGTASTDNGPLRVSEPGNLAIMAYLGNPVAAPGNLDAKYTPTNLLAAF